MTLKMQLSKALAFSLIVLFAPTAWAQNADSSDPAYKKGFVRDSKGRRVTVFNFSDANIEGKVKAPEGFVLQSRRGANFKNILELRKNFHDEISQSAPTGLLASP